MSKLEEHRKIWQGKSDEWLFERLANELTQKVEEIHTLLAENEQLRLCSDMPRFPDNQEIWKWWKEQKFQKEHGEQEYTMIYEIDLPKILKAFTEHLFNRK